MSPPPYYRPWSIIRTQDSFTCWNGSSPTIPFHPSQSLDYLFIPFTSRSSLVTTPLSLVTSVHFSLFLESLPFFDPHDLVPPHYLSISVSLTFSHPYIFFPSAPPFLDFSPPLLLSSYSSCCQFSTSPPSPLFLSLSVILFWWDFFFIFIFFSLTPILRSPLSFISLSSSNTYFLIFRFPFVPSTSSFLSIF